MDYVINLKYHHKRPYKKEIEGCIADKDIQSRRWYKDRAEGDAARLVESINVEPKDPEG